MYDTATTRALQPVRAWRIHLGAHKTATTHLQETLALVRTDLVKLGIDFLPNGAVRQREVAGKLLTSRKARIPILRDWVLDRIARTSIDPLRIGPPVVVMSEENLLGLSEENLLDPSGQIRLGPLYPRTEQVVPKLARLARKAETTFFLSIRSFSTLLPSAYAKMIKKHPTPEGGGFGAIGRVALARPPRWIDFVRRLRRTAPGIPLRIWRQEDYRSHKLPIMAALCGCRVEDMPELPQIEDPPWTRSPSPAAISEAERLPQHLRGMERNAIVNRIYDASRPGSPRFQPFSAAERAVLDEAYAGDLAEIDALDPDMLMHFEEDLPAETPARRSECVPRLRV